MWRPSPGKSDMGRRASPQKNTAGSWLVDIGTRDFIIKGLSAVSRDKASSLTREFLRSFQRCLNLGDYKRVKKAR